MDELVQAAMQKWPNVPDCWGWLALDGRGDWYLRDADCQAAGAFQDRSAWPASKGSRLEHAGLIAFIGRNYGADAQGRCYFQNGPQRVYVELECTPWVWRVAADGAVQSHTGLAAKVQEVWLDEEGSLYLFTTLGFGRVHTSDMWHAAEALERMELPMQSDQRAVFAQRFGFVPSPQAAHSGQQKAR